LPLLWATSATKRDATCLGATASFSRGCETARDARLPFPQPFALLLSFSFFQKPKTDPMRDDYPWDKIYTLDDLRGWSRSAPSLAVIGQPIAHSRSPLMHNTALAVLAHPKLAGWRYFKFEIAPEDLGTALALFRERGFAGLNLTLPHKVLALAHVTRLCGDALAAGATNTLAPDGDGYAGHNTDGEGFVRALRGEFGAEGISGRALVLFGAGGAARGVAAAALRGDFSQILLVNRSAERLSETLAALHKAFPAEAARLRGAVLLADAPAAELAAADSAAADSAAAYRTYTTYRSYKTYKTYKTYPLHPSAATATAASPAAAASAAEPLALPDTAIVVNATSLGLRAGDLSPVPPQLWRRGMLAFDIVCGTGETAFLRDARAAGVSASDGFPMLSYQGALAFEIWTNIPAPAGAMLAALRDSK
jgi:shikimate dehydrogenase